MCGSFWLLMIARPCYLTMHAYFPSRTMRFDPESGAHAARLQQQQANPYGSPTSGYTGGYGYGGPTGGYGGPTGGYGGPTGGYGGPTGGYAGPTGGYAGPTGGYGGPTGAPYTNGGARSSAWQGAGATGQQQQQQQPVQPSSLKDCPSAELLEKLPRMQRLMLRTLACVPEGAAAINPLCLVSVCKACMHVCDQLYVCVFFVIAHAMRHGSVCDDACGHEALDLQRMALVGRLQCPGSAAYSLLDSGFESVQSQPRWCGGVPRQL